MKSFLVLDDQQVRLQAFTTRLKHDVELGVRVVITDSFDVALEEASREKFDIMFLDHDLGDATDVNRIPSMYGESSRSWTGEDFVRCLLNLHKSRWPEEVIIHSWNPDGAKRMKCRLDDAGVSAVINPFK